MKYAKRYLPFLMIFCCHLVNADDVDIENQVSSPGREEVEKLIVDNTIVGFSWVSQPKNKILLIRNGTIRCAIKYLSFSRGHDEKQNSIFKAGSESFSANAEYLVLPDRKARTPK